MADDAMLQFRRLAQHRHARGTVSERRTFAKRDHQCTEQVAKSRRELRQPARSLCAFNRTFGCRQDNTLWVRLGCAGFFWCNGVNIGKCGSEFYRGKFAEATVCSCHQNATLRQEHNLRLGDELDEEPAWRAPQAASSACDGGDQIVWLLQGPRRFEHFKGFGSEDPRRRVIWLTFRERSNHSGDLFPPYRTTWTTGRNLLLEAALKESNQMKGGCGFLYYVFADGDLTFGRRDIEGFEAFLRRRRPLYGTHAACMYEHSKPRFRAELPGRYLDVTNFDGVLAAFHRNSLASSLLPYEPRFDSSSWFYSQLIVTIQTHIMRNLYNLSFVELCWPPECPRSTMWYLNKDHRTYPRSWEPEVPLRWTLNDNLLGFEALYEGSSTPRRWPDQPGGALERLRQLYKPRSDILQRTKRWLQRRDVAQAVYGCGVDEGCAEAASRALSLT